MNIDDRITTHLDVLNVAVHVLLATTGTTETAYLLDKKLQQYEAKLLASSTSDDALQRLELLHKSLSDAAIQGARQPADKPTSQKP